MKGDILAKSFKWIYAKVCLCRICPGVTRRRAARERRKARALTIERDNLPVCIFAHIPWTLGLYFIYLNAYNISITQNMIIFLHSLGGLLYRGRRIGDHIKFLRWREWIERRGRNCCRYSDRDSAFNNLCHYYDWVSEKGNLQSTY